MNVVVIVTFSLDPHFSVLRFSSWCIITLPPFKLKYMHGFGANPSQLKYDIES